MRITFNIIIFMAAITLLGCSKGSNSNNECYKAIKNFTTLDHFPQKEEIYGVYALSDENQFNKWGVDQGIRAVFFKDTSTLSPSYKYVLYEFPSACFHNNEDSTKKFTNFGLWHLAQDGTPEDKLNYSIGLANSRHSYPIQYVAYNYLLQHQGRIVLLLKTENNYCNPIILEKMGELTDSVVLEAKAAFPENPS